MHYSRVAVLCGTMHALTFLGWALKYAALVSDTGKNFNLLCLSGPVTCCWLYAN